MRLAECVAVSLAGLGIFVAGCADAATRPGPPGDPGRRADHASPSASAAPPADEAPIATVSLVGFTCRIDPRAALPEYDRNGVAVDAVFRTVGASCDGASTYATVDDHGRVAAPTKSAPLLPPELGGRGWARATRIGSDIWAAFADDREGVGARRAHLGFTFLAGGPGRWRVASRIEQPVGSSVVGLGAWAGAIVAAFRHPFGTAPPTLVVVEGTPSRPLPAFSGTIGEHFDFATTSAGEAFSVWDQGKPNGGLVLSTWAAGSREARTEVVDGLRSSYPLADAPKLLVRSGSEVYLPVQSGDDQRRFVRVLRFDGRRWSTSLTVEGATSPEAYALSPDGAVWVVAGDDADGSELWRRRPGRDDRWDRIAPKSIGREAKLRVTSILPTHDGSLLFAGVRDRAAHGLHRVHLRGP